MIDPGQAAAKCIYALTASDAKKATMFLSERLVVSVCRRFKHDKRSRSRDWVLKIGAPNFAERAFLRACKAADEPLPVRRVQLRAWPKSRG